VIDLEHKKPVGAEKLDKSVLVADLKKSLQENIFSGRLRMTPRRVGQLAEEIANSVLQFQEREQETDVYQVGERLAEEVGHRAMLALTETLRRVCCEGRHTDAEGWTRVSRYVFSLLEGYMAGREAYLLAEQERARAALERAREKRGNQS
jgi:hypothetical protein